MNHPGIYLLADESIRPYAEWAKLLPAVLDEGPALVQYRAKHVAPPQRAEHAAQLLAWCDERDIPLLINDDPALAHQLGAAGAHIGRDDVAVHQARLLLGPQAWVGSSCYADLERALACEAAGASYASFGRLFPSGTKPQASPASLELLAAARARLRIPICAIGGITLANAPQVLDQGAQLLCVGGGILAEASPATAARKLATICRSY